MCVEVQFVVARQKGVVNCDGQNEHTQRERDLSLLCISLSRDSLLLSLSLALAGAHLQRLQSVC